jgi:exosome complex RNA-binding protein Csl4
MDRISPSIADSELGQTERGLLGERLMRFARLRSSTSSMSLTKGRLARGAKYALMMLAGAALVVVLCSASVLADWPAERASTVRAAEQAAAQQTPAQQTPLTQKVGAVKSINGNALVLTADGGTDVSVTVASNAKIVQVAPGEKDLKSATPIALTDLQVGDRVLVRIRAADDAKAMTAVWVIAMKRTDLEAKKAQDREDWQKRGIGGLVSAVDAATGTITISTGTGATAKTVAIHTTKSTVLRRYAPDSVQFDDAKPAALDQVKPGDQVRARGTKSADGSEFAADEIVSGTFRNLAGIITAIDASAQTISLTDLISKKPVVVKITAQSQLRKIPAQMAQMIAFRLKGGAAGAGAGAAGGSAGAGGASGQEGGAAGGGSSNGGQRSGGAGAGGAGNGAGGGGGRGDFQQIVNRLPASTLADFQKGDAVMVVSTQGSDAGGVTAITMLGGVEAILAAAPAGNAAQAMTLSPWSLGGGAPGGDASGGNP